MIFIDNVKLIIKGNLNKMLEIIAKSKALIFLLWGALGAFIIWTICHTPPEALKILVLHQS